MMNKLMLLVAVLFLSSCATTNMPNVNELDRDSSATLDRLYDTKPGTRDIIEGAAGVLVFPAIYKGGIGVGGEYGDGVLREGGRTSGYYRIVSGTIGLQLGVQRRAQVIAFMDRDALARFKRSSGWEAGVDGSIVVADLGASAQTTTTEVNRPILGFILGEAGLMYNATLEGSKITRITP